MTTAFLSLGSNVRPEENLRLGVRELKRRYRHVTLSPVYRNPAVGFDGDDFLNLAVRCEVSATVDVLLRDIEAIHVLAGRIRGAERNANRTLDIDVLLFGQLAIDTPEFKLPRPDILDYGFVLKPLADLVPDERHPHTGRTFADHWSARCAEGCALTRVELEFS